MAVNVDFRRPQGRSRLSYFSGYNNRNSSKVCSHCGKTGHTIEKCYKMNGYPPNWQRSTLNFTSSSAGEVSEQKEYEDTRMIPAGFTQEQYDKLMSLIQGSTITQQAPASTSQVSRVTKHCPSSLEKSESGIISASSSFSTSCLRSWIIDSGASDHICSSLNCFKTYAPIKLASVKLPKGNSAVAKFVGTIKFSPSFCVTNALYVPDFSFNLLSVSKLTETS